MCRWLSQVPKGTPVALEAASRNATQRVPYRGILDTPRD